MVSFPRVLIDKLEGQANWIDWKFQIKIQLQAHNAWEAVIGVLETPDLSSQVRQLINMCSKSKEMWDKLHSIFEQRTEQRQDRLFNQFLGIKAKDSLKSITKHTARLEKIVVRTTR
ncbi:hypothetical protein NQ317_006812 [Molorchus minor]|uniref:Uncharacterized protein n=1 Tax=Molorchus minor TaxID=1323400 RepID=A0ABQ9JFH1_9CUCU|nr:hypothetical protein NQ317_006812 [Molorchus minor]